MFKHDDPQGLFAMFDRMEERNPGMFEGFLEQLTKWGLQKVAANIKKDLQDEKKGTA